MVICTKTELVDRLNDKMNSRLYLTQHYLHFTRWQPSYSATPGLLTSGEYMCLVFRNVMKWLSTGALLELRVQYSGKVSVRRA